MTAGVKQETRGLGTPVEKCALGCRCSGDGLWGLPAGTPGLAVWPDQRGASEWGEGCSQCREVMWFGKGRYGEAPCTPICQFTPHQFPEPQQGIRPGAAAMETGGARCSGQSHLWTSQTPARALRARLSGCHRLPHTARSRDCHGRKAQPLGIAPT